MKQKKSAPEAIKNIEAREQAAFEQQNEAYRENFYPVVGDRTENASRLDTANNDGTPPDGRFPFAVPNWNDGIPQKEMWDICLQIDTTLRPLILKKMRPQDILSNIERLLNNSFSENIKQHIVTLTATNETVEGACKHCLGFYDTASRNQNISTEISIWLSLCQLVGDVHIYKAFLERTWHLEPTSSAFPYQYRDLVKAVRAQEQDTSLRDGVHYAIPYNQLETLNETASNCAMP